MKKSLAVLAVLAFVFSSCKKEPDPAEPVLPAQNTGGVFITCEGNFQSGNAVLSYFNFDNEQVTADVFNSVNSMALGDVCQSMCIFNGKGYIVVNNSGKIEVINPNNFARLTTINGLSSPRYFLPVDSSKAFVTDLYANQINIVDLTNNSLAGIIPLNGWTEELALVNGTVYVTNEESNCIFLVDPVAQQVVDSISISYASNSLRADANGKLWVLCGGDITNSIPGALHRINPATQQVEASFPFPAGQTPWKLRMNSTGDTLYFLNGGVYRMAITDAGLPSSAFIVQGSANFYGLGIDPASHLIYVSDAIDYVQPGLVLRYRPDGTLVNQFHVGITPGDFCF